MPDIITNLDTEGIIWAILWASQHRKNRTKFAVTNFPLAALMRREGKFLKSLSGSYQAGNADNCVVKLPVAASVVSGGAGTDCHAIKLTGRCNLMIILTFQIVLMTSLEEGSLYMQSSPTWSPTTILHDCTSSEAQTTTSQVPDAKDWNYIQTRYPVKHEALLKITFQKRKHLCPEILYRYTAIWERLGFSISNMLFVSEGKLHDYEERVDLYLL